MPPPRSPSPQRASPYRVCASHTVGYPNDAAIPEGSLAELRPPFVRAWFDPANASRWVRLGVYGGSGSCFYHSVAAIIDYEGYLGADALHRRVLAVQLRRSFVPQMQAAAVARIDDDMGDARPARPPADEAAWERAELADPDEWADEVAIRFVLRALKLNLIFIRDGTCGAFCGVQGDDALAELQGGAEVMQDTGIVSWTNHASHFEPLGRIRDGAAGELDGHSSATDVQFLFHPSQSAADAAIVRQVMLRYSHECDLRVQ